ncbi:hypothetical protein [Ahrensia sp. R2A130]|uniref:hypothetical protein n=1 Tax=Ahrensia sp. R2A130 TaxID=744979 RepID=UPI0001E0F0DB|nr:hypothetical protein [Ahrensia sp. R2A130]EFL88997.1 putative phenol hydroxylase subunit [Ahrensia sp. R2A130]
MAPKTKAAPAEPQCKCSGSPSENSIAHRRVARLLAGDMEECNTRKLVQLARMCLQAAMDLDLPRRCSLAKCRRHRICHFDYTRRTLPTAEQDVWDNMESRGLPLCIARNIEAFQAWSKAG